jgi:flagellar motility protein MotE (MotC chaperone)
MKKRYFAFAPLLLLLILIVLGMKLLVATGTLLSDYPLLAKWFTIPEVQAKDQKKSVSAPPEKPPTGTERPASLAEPMTVHSNSFASTPELLAILEQKEVELKRKEQHLKEQELQLMEMQKDVEQKMQELIAMQKEIQNFRNEKAENKNASVRSLAQIYGSMKPKEAAKLLENMDEKLAVNIISTMKANEAAEILSAMDLKKAAKISEALTQR